MVYPKNWLCATNSGMAERKNEVRKGDTAVWPVEY